MVTPVTERRLVAPSPKEPFEGTKLGAQTKRCGVAKRGHFAVGMGHLNIACRDLTFELQHPCIAGGNNFSVESDLAGKNGDFVHRCHMIRTHTVSLVGHRLECSARCVGLAPETPNSLVGFDESSREIENAGVRHLEVDECLAEGEGVDSLLQLLGARRNSGDVLLGVHRSSSGCVVIAAVEPVSR